ncbi:hypothetical protein OKW21_006108 [Catalinimonas alkaloidigena]|uniref:hypothetical protein n=1 Tax=Catalinimonas alkaloidigena TaxID=1075417 RepID=UPI002405DAAA|nr:hypothetical protein [Catalinimonas alkaloidigena]MDF9800845.1 hypothetical protein [Catalinimonas alkaloidigena]
MSAYNIPALSLAIIHQGKIEWADIYQNENFPEEQKLNCTSIFQFVRVVGKHFLMAIVTFLLFITLAIVTYSFEKHPKRFLRFNYEVEVSA